MQAQTVTVIVSVLGILGTLGGVCGGHLLSRSWQREQWIRDKRDQEFRELLDALSNSFETELLLYAGAVIDEEQQRKLIEGQSKLNRVIRSRLYIVDVVEVSRIESRWANAISAHHHTFDVAALSEEFVDIRNQIVKQALKQKYALR